MQSGLTGLIKGFLFGSKPSIYVTIYQEAEKLKYNGQDAISLMTWNEIKLMQENNMPVFAVTQEIQKQAYKITLNEIKCYVEKK